MTQMLVIVSMIIFALLGKAAQLPDPHELPKVTDEEILGHNGACT